MAVQSPKPIVETLDVPVKGTKRSRTEFENGHESGAVHSVHASPSPCATPDAHLDHFEDDCHEDYEFIRVPKKRDYDLFRVGRHAPETRDKAELPLIAKKLDGTSVVMWAQMDTGSDVNFINQTTLETLYGHDEAHKRMRAMTELEFNMIGDAHYDATHSVDLDITAGTSKKSFPKTNFIIMRDDAATSNTDGVPNVVLGLTFLRTNSMLMIDVEYCNDADGELEVIADRIENENPAALGIRPVKVGSVKRPGFPRPR